MSASIGMFGPFQLSNLTAPASGTTKALLFSVNTPSGGGTTTVSLMNYIQQLGSFRPQGMTIDNSANSVSVTVKETSFGWQRIVNPGQYITFNYPAVQFPIFEITSGAGETVSLTLYDFPVFPESSANFEIGQASQNVNVTNTPLAVTLNSPLNANVDVYVTNITGSAVSSTAAIGTTGLGTYLVGFDFSLTENVTIAVAGVNQFKIVVGTQLIFQTSLYIPAAAVVSGSPSNYTVSQRFRFPYLLNLGTQPTITVTSANALATGNYVVNLYAGDN